MDAVKKTGKNIQSVQRAIDILNCFTAANPALSLGEISARLQLNKATVHGILNTLHNNAYVSQNSKGQYLLGRAFFAKTALTNSSVTSKLLDSLSAPLQEICNKYQASGIVSTIINYNLQRIHMITPTNSAFVLQPSAQSGPLYAMASGKLILAYSDSDFLHDYLSRTALVPLTSKTLSDSNALQENLDKIRSSGCAYERDELAEGISSIAVPVFDSMHKIYATISLTGMTAPILSEQDNIAKKLTELRDTIESQCFIF